VTGRGPAAAGRSYFKNDTSLLTMDTVPWRMTQGRVKGRIHPDKERRDVCATPATYKGRRPEKQVCATPFCEFRISSIVNRQSAIVNRQSSPHPHRRPP
jgi:hypothetical protein